MREKTKLLSISSSDGEKKELTEIIDKIKCINYSKLVCYEYNKITKDICEKIYEHNTKGYIDLDKKKSDNDVFGWDSIFVLEKINKSYDELKKIGIKVSSRNMNISKWINDKIHYKKLVDLNFSPINASRSIDFSLDVYNFVLTNKYYNNEYTSAYGILNILKM